MLRLCASLACLSSVGLAALTSSPLAPSPLLHGLPHAVLNSPGTDAHSPDSEAGLSGTNTGGQDGMQVLHEFFGSSPAERFGGAVAGDLDVDGDGACDIVVGAHHADPSGSSSGAVSVFSGSSGALLYTLAGQAAGDWFGAAVAALDDLNGDGLDEVIVGAPYGAGGLGEVTLHSGLDGTILQRAIGGSSGAQFGDAVAGLGDTNADGISDFIVGAPIHKAGGLLAGRVSLHSGADGSILWSVDGAPGDLLGNSVSPAGDVDGDGCPDVLAGAPLGDAGGFNSGSAYVYSGRDGSQLLALDGSEVGAQLGDRVALAGDIDLDGRVDFILGAPGADAVGIDSGAAEVRSAADGRILLSIPGSGPGQYLQAVAAAGDCDHDGVPDLAVGEAQAGPGPSQRGEVRIVSGRTGETLLIHQGSLNDDWLGASLAHGGDVNGDGRTDLVVGAPGHDDNQQKLGSAQVITCASDEISKKISSPIFPIR